MKLSYLIYIAASCFVVGLVSFILNRFGILTLLDGLTSFNSYVYLIPIGSIMIYIIWMLQAQKITQILLTTFLILASMIFIVIVIIETPTKKQISNTNMIVENRTLIFSGTQRFYQKKGIFYASIFTCEMGESAYCNYEVISDELIITYGYYDFEAFTKVIPIKED